MITWFISRTRSSTRPKNNKIFTNEEETKNYLSTVNFKKVKEQTVFGIEKKKNVKLTTKLVQARIPKELYR